MKRESKVAKHWRGSVRRGTRYARRNFGIQSLECRRALDASAALVAGTLLIQADDAGCEITITQDGESVCVASGTEPIATLPADAVDAIHFEGGDGSDVVHNDTDIPSDMYGGGGDDTLSGGSADDTMDGGSGNDMISGQDGHDVIFGGSGDDTLIGGLGDDELSGGSGQDLLSGGDGDDYVNGGTDQDSLSGGTGADEVVVDPYGTSDLVADDVTDLDPDDTTIDATLVGSSETSDVFEGGTIAESDFMLPPATPDPTLVSSSEPTGT